MKKLLFITILALLMLSGCVKTVTLVVYNNSGKDVCITALGRKHDLKRQTAIRILAYAGIADGFCPQFLKITYDPDGRQSIA